MKKKAIVSLLASCAILLAGCGGGSGTNTPAPAPTPAAPAQQQATAPAAPSAPAAPAAPSVRPASAGQPEPAKQQLLGLWAYSDRNMWVQLWGDHTWAMFNEQGGKTSEGNWDIDGSSAVLYYSDGGYFTTMSLTGSGDLLDGDGVTLVPVSELPSQNFPSVDPSAFVGLWQFWGDNVWLQIWGDGTWALYNENGGQVGGGGWRVDLGQADLYNGDGSYYTSLSPDVGGLTDSYGNSLIYSDEIGSGAPDDPSYDTDWDEIASFEGWWYLGGDLSAEHYIYFNNSGEWTYYYRTAGMEPTMVDSGSIVSSAGEPHAYYANSYNGHTSTYFRFSPSWENGTGYNQIYWDNAGYLFVWME